MTRNQRLTVAVLWAITAVLASAAIVALVNPAAAQQPAPAKDPALSPEAHARLEKLVLERNAVSLQMEILRRDFQLRQRDLDDKGKELEAAIAEEAAKAKVDPKQVRPDLSTKTWRKSAQ